MENDGYSICFNEWAMDKDIKNELGLLLIISSLCAERGYCFASNKYFADKFGTNVDRISKRIKKLESKGYIVVDYKKRGNEIISREIRLSKLSSDQRQNCLPTKDKNGKENNTSINNTSINKKKVNKEKVTFEEIKAYIEEKDLNVDAQQFFDYFEAGNWTDSKGNKVKNWKQKLLTWNKYTKPKTYETKTISYEEDAFKW